LLVGMKPESEQGKEYFLHCLDWWHEILSVLRVILKENLSFDEYFNSESLFTPPTPYVNAEQGARLGITILNKVTNGSVRTCLERLYDEDPIFIEAVADDINERVSRLDHREQQILELALFFNDCGGCRASWYVPNEG
jgi:hypothetical protein